MAVCGKGSRPRFRVVRIFRISYPRRDQWDDRAKPFVQESMNIIPPEIRDGFAGAYVKECEQIARQKNSSVITPEITAEALESIAKKGNMPPAVMRNIPKTIDDFQKPRIRLP